MDGEDIGLPTFNGNGVEDLEQHWFLCEVVWMVRQVHNTDIRKVQMIMTLRGCALEWFMKFSIVPAGNPEKTLDGIRLMMICEFIKTKYESQCIIKIKEIKHLLTKSVWDFDQRFKNLMAKVSFQMSNV